MNGSRIAVIGAGRVGLTLARALRRSGCDVAVLVRAGHNVADASLSVSTDWSPLLAAADLILIAVPDDAIGDVASTVASLGVLHGSQVVLHTSGLQGSNALVPLRSTGAALGSWHPLQTFIERDDNKDALAGAPVMVEGDVRAVAAGRELAQRLGLSPVIEVPSEGKASYHAAAVMASNYVVTLADVANRLARDAGIDPVPVDLFLPLMRRTVDHLSHGPMLALTGPIRRGDVGTVKRHLEVLEGDERAVYVTLGRETLRLARSAGLDQQMADAIAAILY